MSVIRIVVAYIVLSFIAGCIHSYRGGSHAMLVGSFIGGGIVLLALLAWLYQTHKQYVNDQKSNAGASVSNIIKGLKYITPDLRYWLRDLTVVPDNITLTVRFRTDKLKFITLGPRFIAECITPRIVNYYFKIDSVFGLISDILIIESKFDDILSISGPSPAGTWIQT